MFFDAPYGSLLTDAFKLASERGILPTYMGTEELRQIETALKAKAVFSARTTHAGYLQVLRTEINKLIEGGYGSTPAEIRVRLKEVLVQVAYNPVTGFPGDEALGIPPAVPGSLKDLSSDKRINLILETQTRMLAGKGQQQRGLDPAAVDQFPAYELVRGGVVKVPREWLKRFKIAADNVDWAGVSKEAFDQGRMVALKASDVWGACGSSVLFDDALDVAHPPFAFGSQMVWDVVDREECLKVGLIAPQGQTAIQKMVRDFLRRNWGEFAKGTSLDQDLPVVAELPPSVASVNGLDKDFVRRLRSKLDVIEERGGRLSLQGVFGVAAPPPAKRSRTNALLACVDAMDVYHSFKASA